ncbi:TPA: Arc family DNA-binding protein [Acinetobacter baumannii]|uniref:Arc family DNA-binding protein n=1 Tax=Acinetobacter baumannii TaxID=470 RepID=UPI00041176AF|nr:Arc family DNA-binding protein [Acinetobacter baumannii]RSP29294.1 Arc family DNA-binding protein [Acinetobacter baumannii]HBN5965372.1 Arc family DNA-binding protein [Acinetobacter baumannii]HCA5024646.1 Arc family DNA-binding protein [Acinetobacter baumannii]
MLDIIKPRHKIQYNLRIEHELHDWLKKIAKENERPVNYVINQAIKNMRKEIEGVKA